ncbi:MAG: hypothetical protein MUE46_12650 [Xanthomonadales bacterium]|jgi:hypothetical protein|nr:hypothetical protein [Xanthomonadales bacterium]
MRGGPATATHRPAPSPARVRLYYAVTLLLLLACAEGIAALAAGFLASRGVFYTPVAGDYARYLDIHDPLLGWPARAEQVPRPSLRFPQRELQPPVLSAYGDSYTQSAEVGDAEAWPEQLAVRWNARVDNHGRGGYGSDQAFLRFRRDLAEGAEVADVVLLVHLSENLLRNLNQFRDLLYGGDGLGFKPRFVLDAAGQLTLIPLPLPTTADYPAFITDPTPFLAHERFRLDGPEGPRRMGFPYLPEVALAFGHRRIVDFLRGVPEYERFHDPAHPAQGVKLSAAILEAFWREALVSGRTGLPVLMPTGLDLAYQRRHGRLPYQPLGDELARRGVPVLDLGPPLAAAMAGQAIEDYYSGGDLGRHPNARGYALIADRIAAHLATLEEIATKSDGSVH